MPSEILHGFDQQQENAPIVMPRANDPSLEVMDAAAANPALGKFVLEQQAAGQTMKEILAVMTQQADGQQATQDLLRESIRQPVKVNVRVQTPGSASPRGNGMAVLGVQGG